ncbi:hypothetical protein HK104_008069 [Borealophlyctis nickersoniae]|nr:hypothetical protein HK104_008069 [Borealophlyctis nickersoniae]
MRELLRAFSHDTFPPSATAAAGGKPSTGLSQTGSALSVTEIPSTSTTPTTSTGHLPASGSSVTSLKPLPGTPSPSGVNSPKIPPKGAGIERAFEAIGNVLKLGKGGEAGSPTTQQPPQHQGVHPSSIVSKLAGLSMKYGSRAHSGGQEGQMSDVEVDQDMELELEKKRCGNGLGSAVEVTAPQLIDFLAISSSSSPQDDARPVTAPWPSSASVLLVDLRTMTDFARCRIRGSANLNLPPLMLKRFKRGSVSSFQISNFLTNPESKEAYERWSTGYRIGEDGAVDDNGSADNRPRAVVVYDEDMNEAIRETEAWALVKILATGFVEEISRGSLLDQGGRPTIAWLRGGLRAFQDAPGAEAFLCSADGSSVPPVSPARRAMGIPAKDAVSLPSFSAPQSSVKQGISLNTANNNPLPTNLAALSSPTGAARMRKKSAFTIITAPAAPQRARGHTVGALSINSAVASHTLDIPKDESNRGRSAGTPSVSVQAAVSSPLQEEPTPRSSLPPAIGSDTHLTPSDNVAPRAITPTVRTPVEPISQVLPYLFLGSDVIPQSLDGVEKLQALGITHILNMAAEVKNDRLSQGNHFVLKWCKCEDHAEHDVESALKEAIDFIAQARASSPNAVILVHCKAGRSRSSTAVIAYLLAKERMTLREAYETVKRARPGVSPNLGFMLALMKLEKDIYGENTSIADLGV